MNPTRLPTTPYSTLQASTLHYNLRHYVHEQNNTIHTGTLHTLQYHTRTHIHWNTYTTPTLHTTLNNPLTTPRNHLTYTRIQQHCIHTSHTLRTRTQQPNTRPTRVHQHWNLHIPYTRNNTTPYTQPIPNKTSPQIHYTQTLPRESNTHAPTTPNRPNPSNFHSEAPVASEDERTGRKTHREPGKWGQRESYG